VRKALLAVAVFAALVSSSACAGAGARLSHQEYEREMQAIARDMAARAGGMETLASAPSQDSFAKLLRQLEVLVSEGADRVSAVNPPEEIDEPHETLADALQEVADILDEAADKAEDGDFFGAMAVLEEASEDLDSEVRQAISDIRTAGFYLGDDEAWG
jgi:hypothetical protein